MATTWATLIDRCESSLNDSGNAEWSTAEIAEWLNDFTRDYSQYFPLLKVQTISCSAATKEYDLAADFMGVLSVEYPTGETPREYLQRITFNRPEFQNDGWYDVIEHSDDTDPAELWISTSPDDGEEIDVVYNGHHALIANTASISGNTTIPPMHQPLAIKYVLWQATLNLLFAEQQAPTSNSSLLMSQYSQTARRLETSYHTAIRQALYAADGVSKNVRWISGDYSAENSLGRVY